MPEPDATHARLRRRMKASALDALESGRVGLQELLEGPMSGGRATRHSLLFTCSRNLAHTDLWEVLLRTPRLGRKGARRLCEESGVWPHTPMQELTLQNRRSLVERLPDRVRQ